MLAWVFVTLAALRAPGRAPADDAPPAVAAVETASDRDPNAPAEAVPRRDVATVVLRLPIVGTRDKQVMAAIQRTIARLQPRPGERSILVLQFSPGDEGDVSDFGRAWDLARFLGDPALAGVKTIAFLPQGVRGHALLVALACEQIVVGADATIGPATLGDEAARGAGGIDEAVRTAYVGVAARHRTVPPAVAAAFVDPGARVVRASTDDGEQYVAEADLVAMRQRVAVLAVEEVGPAPLAVNGRRARSMGLAGLLADTPADLARGLGVDERALLADPLGTEGWNAGEVTLAGPIGAESVARTQRRIDRLLAEGINFVCLRIDSRGGEPDQSMVLAGWLAALDPTRVRTVAYVDREAVGDAALVALACDDLVMAPDAVLGGPGDVVIDGDRAEAIAVAWDKGVATVRERSWSLPMALVLPGLVVHRATQAATGRTDFFCAAELARRPDREGWQLGAQVAVSPARLTAAEAEALRLTGRVVDGLDGIAQAYGIDGTIRVSTPGWAETLLESLASEEMGWLLLLIGGAALVFELQTPGIGLGGFVATVAFVVYFWAQYLRGTSGSLEVMLFLVGLFCLAMEIFVLPGLGVLGLGGGLLMVAALVLASQSFILPANEYQIRQLEWSLLGLLGAAIGVAVIAVLMRRWLPFIPGLREVIAVGDGAAGQVETTDGVLDGSVLPSPGGTGTTTTRLAPAGKAMIDGRLYDVASDGPLVEPGVAVTVVSVRGSRILVRADAP